MFSEKILLMKQEQNFIQLTKQTVEYEKEHLGIKKIRRIVKNKAEEIYQKAEQKQEARDKK